MTYRSVSSWSLKRKLKVKDSIKGSDILVSNSIEQIPFEDSTILVFDSNIFEEGVPKSGKR